QLDGANRQRRCHRRNESSESFVRQVVDLDFNVATSVRGVHETRSRGILLHQCEESVIGSAANPAYEARSKPKELGVKRLAFQMRGGYSHAHGMVGERNNSDLGPDCRRQLCGCCTEWQVELTLPGHADFTQPSLAARWSDQRDAGRKA